MNDLPRADSMAISAAGVIAAMHEVNHVGKKFAFPVSERSIEALQSDYALIVLKDLNLNLRFEGCGSFCVAWVERKRTYD